MSRFLATALLALASLLLGGCVGDPGEEPQATYKVALRDDFFEPATFNAVSGELVTWKNLGKGTHTVTVQDPGGGPGEYLYNEELIGPGGTAEYAFPGPGTYDVFCIYHSQGAAGDFSGGMVMKVVIG